MSFFFIRIVLLGCCITVSGLAKVAIFTTKLHTKHELQIYEKLSYEALHRHFCQTRVTAQWFCLLCQCPPCFQRFYSPFSYPEKRFFCLSAMSGRERFNFCEAREFFLSYRAFAFGISFCLQVGLALCRPQERGRQCAKSV